MRARTPGADDVFLVIEVADSSVRMDMGRKARIYAAAGVREYWVVDLVHERIVVHKEPGRQEYASVRSLTRREVVFTGALPGKEWTVDAILGI